MLQLYNKIGFIRSFHSSPTMGMRFGLENKIITYCSDTGVCDNDILLAKEADLLIHECSNFQANDEKWGHVIPEAAADIAKKANSKRLVLTHFSPPEYPTLGHRQQAESRAKSIFPNTTVASDGYSIEV